MSENQYSELNLNELAHFMKDTKDALLEAKAKVSEIQKVFDDLRKRAIPDKMEEMGIENAKITGVGRIALRAEAYAGFAKEMKEDAIQWLEQNGHSDLVKEDVNASTLKAFLKEQIRNGEVVPDNLFKFDPYLMATITKS